MEFVKFKIAPIQKSAFERDFVSILREGKITCNQWEFQHGDNYTIVEIPKSVIDNMNPEQIEILESYSIK